MSNQDNQGLDLNELYIEELGQVTGGAEQKSVLRFPRITPITLSLGEGDVPVLPPPPPKPPTHTLFEDILHWLPITRQGT
jgi:hypothetical protein